MSGGSVEAEQARPPVSEAARKRVAVELIARHEQAVRRTARRYSLCAEDAEDAYQRALEILLTKAPTDDLRELIRWMQTVTKHEALAVRRHRERMLAAPPTDGEGQAQDWVQLIPSERDGPAEVAARRERVARSREALQALKPQELRALTLLAEGYSYAEIGEITGFSRTKINRCLAEGRARFRALVASSEDGSRCDQLGSLLSAFCDGETNPKETAAVREHLRVCAHCRATLRAYRAAPRAAAALAPALPLSQGLLGRAHDFLLNLYSRTLGHGRAADSALTQAATAGGAKGAGLAMAGKVAAACVGTAGGAAACVAAGVVPTPIHVGAQHLKPPALERVDKGSLRMDAGAKRILQAPQPSSSQTAPEPKPASRVDDGQRSRHGDTAPDAGDSAPAVALGAQTEAPAAPSPAAPAPPPTPSPPPSSSSASPAPSSSAVLGAGEFGP